MLASERRRVQRREGVCKRETSVVVTRPVARERGTGVVERACRDRVYVGRSPSERPR